MIGPVSPTAGELRRLRAAVHVEEEDDVNEGFGAAAEPERRVPAAAAAAPLRVAAAVAPACKHTYDSRLCSQSVGWY